MKTLYDVLVNNTSEEYYAEIEHKIKLFQKKTIAKLKRMGLHDSDFNKNENGVYEVRIKGHDTIGFISLGGPIKLNPDAKQSGLRKTSYISYPVGKIDKGNITVEYGELKELDMEYLADSHQEYGFKDLSPDSNFKDLNQIRYALRFAMLLKKRKIPFIENPSRKEVIQALEERVKNSMEATTALVDLMKSF